MINWFSIDQQQLYDLLYQSKIPFSYLLKKEYTHYSKTKQSDFMNILPSGWSVEFLPPNTTALIQPLDGGMINVFN